MGICSLRWSTAFRRRFAGIPAKAGTPAKGIRDLRRRGFTLVELLVVITIIALLAAVTLGALAKTREAACLDATKATIDKLNMLVMRRYESYLRGEYPWTSQSLKLGAEAVCDAPHAGPPRPDADGNARTLVRCLRTASQW